MIGSSAHATRLACQAVRAMVGDRVRVVVDAGSGRPAAPGDEQAGASISGPVWVELAAPGEAPFADRTSAVGEAWAWDADEIVSAARRAAERALKSYPAWRRPAAAGDPNGPAGPAPDYQVIP